MYIHPTLNCQTMKSTTMLLVSVPDMIIISGLVKTYFIIKNKLIDKSVIIYRLFCTYHQTFFAYFRHLW